MSGKINFLIILLTVSAAWAGNSDTLFIKSGHVYLGKGEWSPPGQLWAITEQTAYPLNFGTRKPGCLDMSAYFMIPAFQNIWISQPLDSSFGHYPYVQTGLPKQSLIKLYNAYIIKGLLSFYLYPDTTYIRSGDVLHGNYPGTFTLEGLLMDGEMSLDTLMSDVIPSMEKSFSRRERERMLQWRNHEFPLYLFQSGYLYDIWNESGNIKCGVRKVIHTVNDMEGVGRNSSIIVRDPDLEAFLKEMYTLKKNEKEYLFDILTNSGVGHEKDIPPYFLFLNKNPLKGESHVIFRLIHGKFTKNH
jgi:hypothetical protein